MDLSASKKEGKQLDTTLLFSICMMSFLSNHFLSLSESFISAVIVMILAGSGDLCNLIRNEDKGYRSPWHAKESNLITIGSEMDGENGETRTYLYLSYLKIFFYLYVNLNKMLSICHCFPFKGNIMYKTSLAV